MKILIIVCLMFSFNIFAVDLPKLDISVNATGHIGSFINENEDFKADGYLSAAADILRYKGVIFGLFFDEQIYMGVQSDAIAFDPNYTNYSINPFFRTFQMDHHIAFELLHECYHFIDRDPHLIDDDVAYWNAPAIKIMSDYAYRKTAPELFSGNRVGGLSSTCYAYSIGLAKYLSGNLGMGIDPTITGGGQDFKSHYELILSYFPVTKFNSLLSVTLALKYYNAIDALYQKHRFKVALTRLGGTDAVGLYFEYFLKDTSPFRSKDGLALWGIEGDF